MLTVFFLCLWLRSYWWLDNVNFSMTETKVVQSFQGILSLHLRPKFTEPGVTSLAYQDWALALKPPNHNQMPNWYFGSSASSTAIRCPHWFVAILLCAGVVIASLVWRFSLRTLLIATTIVAVALGLITWTTR